MDTLFMAKQDLTTHELHLLASEMEKRKKSKGVTWLLFLLLGGIGAHRFYLGQTATAVLMFCLWLFLGFSTFFLLTAVWMLVDLFLLSGMIRYTNEDIEMDIIDEIMQMRKARENDRRAELHSSKEDTISLVK